jgi:AcrR family transcriptional regulator
MSPAGRRPGPQKTRGAILDAARHEFVARGYAATTIRSVARSAEVDPALVYHYFNDKPQLFAATLDFPFDPRAVGDAAMPDDAPFDGTRLAEEFLARFEQAPGGAGFIALAQAAASSQEAARAIREFLAARIRITAPGSEPGDAWGQRHSMVASALIGTAWSRWILGVEPLASAPRDEVARWLGPTLDHFATSTAFSSEEPLGGPAHRDARFDEHERTPDELRQPPVKAKTNAAAKR